MEELFTLRFNLLDVVLICAIFYYFMPLIFLIEFAEYNKTTFKKILYILLKHEENNKSL